MENVTNMVFVMYPDDYEVRFKFNKFFQIDINKSSCLFCYTHNINYVVNKLNVIKM